MAATFHGFKVSTSPGTAVPLATVETRANWISIFPRVVGGVANVGEVRIGGTGAIASGSGMPLSPGDSGVAWPVSQTTYDLRFIFLDVDNSGDGVQFIYGVV